MLNQNVNGSSRSITGDSFGDVALCDVAFARVRQFCGRGGAEGELSRRGAGARHHQPCWIERGIGGVETMTPFLKCSAYSSSGSPTARSTGCASIASRTS